MAPQRFSPRVPDGISRRDFLNGVLLSAGTAPIGAAWAGQNDDDFRTPAPPPGADGGSIDADPRALRGGNLPATFDVAHLMRDNLLAFTAHSVTVASSTRDAMNGSFTLLEDTGSYDVIIVGSGMSGLSAAFFLMRRRPGTRILVLDGNPAFGGNAGRDDAPPIPVIAATGGAYAVSPYSDMLDEIYRTIGINWDAHAVAAPLYCYYFDEYTPFVLPGRRGWVLDAYGKGMDHMPYPPQVLADLKKSRQDMLDWLEQDDGPTDPADESHPRYDDLAGITLDDYLRKKRGYHKAVSDFYTRYTVDALGGTAKQVSAYSGISFLQGEYSPLFALPGGNEGIARYLVRWLIPDAIPGTTMADTITNPARPEQLDNPRHAVRLRQKAMVVRADTGAEGSSVVYFKDGKFHRARAKAVILAGQAHSTRHLVAHLVANTPQQVALAQFTQVPVVVANVTLRRAAALVQLGLGYDEYWWGSKYWADFVIADWVTPRRHDPDRPTVLTFYGGNTAPPGAVTVERVKLLTTPFAEYEQSLREDLLRVLAGSGFDFDRDVIAIYVYRWGHGLVYPRPGLAFGPPQQKDGKVVRTPSFRHTARQQIGRISIGSQDTEGAPSIESAIGAGLRTAQEVLPLL